MNKDNQTKQLSMEEALRLQNLHAKVLKEEKSEIVIKLEAIGFRFGKKQDITIKPIDRNVI